MTVRLNVSATQRADLERIARLESEALKQVAALLQSPFKIPTRASELRKLIEPAIPGQDSKILSRQLIALARFKRDYAVSEDELIDGLTSSISTFDDWGSDLDELWKSKAGLIKHLLTLSPVCVVAKTHDLVFDYDNLFVAARIITDIRPVFDDKHDEVISAIISHTLRLEYSSSGATRGFQSLSFAVDGDDIKRLREQCDNAMKKAEIIKTRVLKKCNLPAYLIGEDEDEYDEV